MFAIEICKERKKVIYKGEVIENSEIHVDSDKKKYCYIYDDKYLELIRDEKINGLFNGQIKEIQMKMNEQEVDRFKKELFFCDSTRIIYSNGKYRIDFFGYYNLEEWDKGFSIVQYINKLKSFIDSNQEMEIELADEDLGLGVSLCISKEIICTNSTFREEEMKLLNIFFDIHAEIHNELLNADKHSVYVEFDIEEPFKTVYSQYLVYFIQFLKDLGIESHTSITEQANKILLEVTPVDKETALKSIRHCLSVYLRLTDSKEIEVYDDYTNVAYMQLKANIGHLKSQLMLAQTAIGQQQATIEQQNITINTMKYINNEKVMVQLEETEMKLLDGVISFGEIDCKVFKFDLGKLLKILFRRC